MEEESLKILKEQIISYSELQELFQVSKTTLWKWVKAGVIRQHKLGGMPVFLKDELLEDIRSDGNSRGRRGKKFQKILGEK